jgi:hypothetical protein
MNNTTGCLHDQARFYFQFAICVIFIILSLSFENIEDIHMRIFRMIPFNYAGISCIVLNICYRAVL